MMSARGAAGLALSCAQPLPEGVAAQREIAVLASRADGDARRGPDLSATP